MYFGHSTSVHGVEKKVLSPPERLLGDLGQGTGTQGALSVAGQSEVPWKWNCDGRGGGSSGSSRRAKVASNAVHTHSHTHTLTPATLGFTFPSPPPLSYTQR